MTDTPLNSTDHAKILIFGLLMLPAIGLGLGIIPAIFLLFGLFMRSKSGDFSHIETAIRNYKLYSYLLIAIFGFIAMTSGSERGVFEVSLSIMLSTIFALVSVKFLFQAPLVAHAEWVAKNGIFSSKPKAGNDSSNSEVQILKGDRLKHYSVADELIKWAKLKEDGHITELQYEQAREKILQKN